MRLALLAFLAAFATGGTALAGAIDTPELTTAVCSRWTGRPSRCQNGIAGKRYRICTRIFSGPDWATAGFASRHPRIWTGCFGSPIPLPSIRESRGILPTCNKYCPSLNRAVPRATGSASSCTKHWSATGDSTRPDFIAHGIPRWMSSRFQTSGAPCHPARTKFLCMTRILWNSASRRVAWISPAEFASSSSAIRPAAFPEPPPASPARDPTWLDPCTSTPSGSPLWACVCTSRRSRSGTGSARSSVLSSPGIAMTGR